MNPVSNSDFAEKLGVNRSTISQALHGPLKQAKVKRGVIDMDHPSVIEYMLATKLRLEQYEAGAKPRGRVSKFKKRSRAESVKNVSQNQVDESHTKVKFEPEQVEMILDDLPDDVREIAHLPLVEVIRQYGTASALKEYVTAVKYMEQTYKLKIENRRQEGELIERTLLLALLGILDGAYIDMLKDGSKNISRRTAQKTLAGELPEDIEIFVRETIGRYLKIANTKIKLAVKAVLE